MNQCISSVKASLIACCDALMAVAAEKAVEYGDSVCSRLEKLKTDIASHVFKVYLVGPFSCGKSSLLNRWLGVDILTTGLAPETAVSSELRFGETERMVLQSLRTYGDAEHDSGEELLGITEENMIHVKDLANQQKIANVILYMNNPRLKQYADICLVDLPGLSSANPAHEAALLRFIQSTERIAVFCVPMTDGTIQGDAFEFMKKVFSYGVEPTLLLTKADERPVSDHATIMNLVRKHLHEYGWTDVFVGKVSKDSIGDFEELIRKYNEQKDDYILRWFGEKVRGIAEDMLTSLRRSLAAQYDDSRIEDALEKIHATETELPLLVKEINHDMSMFARDAISDVMVKVHDSVMGQQGDLMSKTERGIDCAAEISALIRSTLACEAPLAIEDTLTAAKNKAGELLDERLNLEFLGDSQVVGSMVDSSSPILSYSPKCEDSFLESFKKCVTIGETAFLLGELLLPGPGGLIGAAIASAAMFFMGAKNPSEELSYRQAQFTMELENACKRAHPDIERIMMNAIDVCSKKLQLAVEGKVRELHEQIELLKKESEAGKKTWEKHQAIRRATLDRVGAVLLKAGITRNRT